MKIIKMILFPIITVCTVLLFNAQKTFADMLPINKDESAESASRYKGSFDYIGSEHIIVGIAVILIVVLSFVLFSKNRKK